MQRLVERLVRVSDDPLVELLVAETAGDRARTLLVIHGGPDWDQMYLRQPLVDLAGDRRVVFADLRGCGRSTRGLPAAALTPAEAVDDLIVLIEHLGAPVDVLGFSYGGQLVQRLLVTTPERVRRTVVASSSILPVPPDAFAGRSERDARLARARAGVGEDDVACGAERTRRDAVRSAVTDLWRQELRPEYLSRLALVHFSSDWSRAWPDRSKIPPARPEQAVNRLRGLGKPLLLLHGRQDMTFPAELVEPTTELIPTARGVVLEQAGHMAHVDQPDAWLGAVRTFLDAEDDR